MTGTFYLPNKALSMCQDLLTALVRPILMCCGTQDVRGPVPRELHDRQRWSRSRERVLRCLQSLGQADSTLQLAAPTVVDPFVQ